MWLDLIHIVLAWWVKFFEIPPIIPLPILTTRLTGSPNVAWALYLFTNRTQDGQRTSLTLHEINTDEASSIFCPERPPAPFGYYLRVFFPGSPPHVQNDGYSCCLLPLYFALEGREEGRTFSSSKPLASALSEPILPYQAWPSAPSG